FMCHPELVRHDNIRMPQAESDFAFGGLFEFGGKAGFEAFCFFLVEHFKRHDFSRERVARPPDAGHASLADPADELEAPRDIGPGSALFALEQVLEEFEFHAARLDEPRQNKFYKKIKPR